MGQKLSVTFILLLFLVSCGGDLPYEETFDEAGTWSVGEDNAVDGAVRDGVYDMLVFADDVNIWATAGESFSDGIYQVEATQTAGPLNNGYGMVFRFDEESSDFYVFKVSGDGFVWIGKYLSGGQEGVEPLVGEWWIESAAVKKGLNQTNLLKIRAEDGNLLFYVNEAEVGRVTDNTLRSGDVGVLVQTLGLGGVQVEFDNFTVLPLDGMIE